MISLMKTIAERLKHARGLKGWTQAQLAAAAGVSQSAIGNIEAGVRNSRGSLPEIAEALGISRKWLADGIGEMKETERRHAPASNLTPEAQSLAMLFDELTDRRDRTRAYNVASEYILKLLDEREPRPSVPPGRAAPARTR